MFKRKAKTALATTVEPAAPTTADIFPVSFIVIATKEDWDKNQQKFLSCLPHNAEINVVFNEHGEDDTLSDIAIKPIGTATLRFRVWTYSGRFHFGRARQYSAEMATNDWVMWLDCDDRINPMHHERIRQVTSWSDHGIGAVMCSCTSMHTPIPPNKDPEYHAVKQARIYKRSTGAEWEGRCHEQIFPSVQRRGFTHAHSTIAIEHTGYEGSLDGLLPRNRRNVDLLCHEIGELGLLARDGFTLTMLHRDINSLHAMENANGR